MQCKDCGEEIDAEDAIKVKVKGRTVKLCEDCAEVREQEAEIGDAAESAVQDMMGYKGRW